MVQLTWMASATLGGQKYWGQLQLKDNVPVYGHFTLDSRYQT
jgi:hypothetical protein